MGRLEPTQLQTRLGAKVVLHAGQLVYPCAAFEPGARVHVVLIPESGGNIENDIPSSELVPFSSRRAEIAAASLLDTRAEDVELKVGKPARIEGRRWTYEAGGETLFVYFNDSNVVVDVRPPSFDISALKKK